MKDAEKDTIRLNFEFPRKEYPYLKMLCAQKGMSFKKVATEALMKMIEDYEEEVLAQKAQERLEEMKEEDRISWEEATRLAGWDDEEVQD
ncbi:MAG: hypothetical protein K940chlam9_00695 [Chlamydiae bacterium]|nr:hypothetical protein [Chlamydiota bacterium]